jgi:hypothetical protein
MQIHVLVRSLFVVQAGVLKDDTEALARQLLLHRGIQPIELDAAAGRPQQRSKHLDGGSLARSVRSQEGKYLSLRHVEADVINRREISEFFDQIADRNHLRVVLLLANGLPIETILNSSVMGQVSSFTVSNHRTEFRQDPGHKFSLLTNPLDVENWRLDPTLFQKRNKMALKRREQRR